MTSPKSEPGCGSVVMLHGDTGTAWQRLFIDMQWHSTTGQVTDWDDLNSRGTEVRVIHLVRGGFAVARKEEGSGAVPRSNT